MLLKDNLDLPDFISLIYTADTIEITPEIKNRVEESYTFLKDFAKNKIIYGVNTGFGPMAQYKIKDEDGIQLQYNLIRSHATGTGEKIPPIYIKAAMIARLNTLCLGYSGIHISVIELMQNLINRNILPVVYAHGGVGASGDLVQLAHLALVLIGEGEAHYKGSICPTGEIFEKEKLRPIQVNLREGLGIINGTSFMTGIGIINIIQAKKLLYWSIKCSAVINEIVSAYDDHLSLELNASKKHEGQRVIADRMRNHLQDSQLIKKREHFLYNGKTTGAVFNEKVQEYYSLRCVPQILGPVLDTMEQVEKVLLEEVNSANDNPIVDVKNKHVYHGGNFHGDYVSLEMDKLKLVITKLSILAERQLNYLLNSKLNDLLPPFVNLGTLGLNFGLQGAQFTATSTTAENQMLSNSMYVHSIPNNNDNQDVVSMGTNAALITKKVIENAFEVLAIEVLTIVQAIDALDILEKTSNETKKMHSEIRKLVPKLVNDEVLYPYINKIKDYISEIDGR